MTTSQDLSAATLFAALPLSEAAKRDLAGRMAEPHRFYHGQAHIELLWSRHRLFASGPDLIDPEAETPIALAIAFHDAVYVGSAKDNEAKSASLWLEVSGREAVCGEAVRSWVADTIIATADHLGAARRLDLADPREHARQWVLDLDLTPLGEEPDVFDANMDDLAAEMSEGSAEDRRGRLLVGLRHFATAQPLLRCPPLHARFEEQAQRNFARHLRHSSD